VSSDNGIRSYNLPHVDSTVQRFVHPAVLQQIMAKLQRESTGSSLTIFGCVWDIPTMTVSMTDDKRRLTMPKELPPGSAVTIERVNEDTWVVKRQKPTGKLVMVAFPRIERLPDDPEWEKIERRMVAHNNKKLPHFEE
jgi:hypothetical protein